MNPMKFKGVILNVDGSTLGNPGRAGYGAIIRDAHGNWIAGMSGCIGTSDNLTAELHGICHGLELAWNLGVRKLLCYSDSKEAIRLISEPIQRFRLCASIISLSRIKRLLMRRGSVEIVHKWREGNFGADFLAKQGAGGCEAHRVWSSPPMLVGPSF